MSIFAVIAKAEEKNVRGRVTSIIPEGDWFEFKDDVWFVEFKGTSQDLAEKLGIRSGNVGAGIVIPISNYSGRAPSDTWEWLRAHWPGAS
jgi:hypothetical protein